MTVGRTRAWGLAAVLTLVAGSGVALGGCGGSARGNGANARASASPEVLFEDDFSVDRGWTSNVPADIWVDTTSTVARWHAKRNTIQHMTLPLTQVVSGDLTVEATLQMDAFTNNSDILVGLTSDIEATVPNNPPPGLYARIAFFGGGCWNQLFHASGLYVDGQGTAHGLTRGYVCSQSANAPVSLGNFVTVPDATPIRIQVSIAGSELTMRAYFADTDVLFGTQTATVTGTMPTLRYAYIGNPGDTDWPEAIGLVYDLRATR